MKITKWQPPAKSLTGSFTHRQKWFNLVLFALLITSCTPKDEAQKVVDRAIEHAGGDLYNHSEVSFRFRDIDYSARHNEGLYEYIRIIDDSVGIIRDVLNNDGFYREINGQKVDLIDTMAAKYARSVNSVIYFALLPDALNDPAVIKEYLGKKEMDGKTYDKIKVTFKQEGGGAHYEDEFVYWFEENTGDLDYMAYLYFTDGGGMRFRKAYNAREVNGIRFSDYINYEASDTVSLVHMDDAFNQGALKELSLIELENIQVVPL
jgi:hypothetical protein